MIGQVSSLNGIRGWGGGRGKDMKGKLDPRGKLQKHFFFKINNKLVSSVTWRKV